MLAEAERKLANLSPATNLQKVDTGRSKGHGHQRHRRRALEVGRAEREYRPNGPAELLVLWLVLLFASYGLFAPRHATTMVMLLLSSAATAGAIALIIDLERPIGGFVGLSAEPMEHAVAELSR